MVASPLVGTPIQVCPAGTASGRPRDTRPALVGRTIPVETGEPGIHPRLGQHGLQVGGEVKGFGSQDPERPHGLPEGVPVAVALPCWAGIVGDFAGDGVLLALDETHDPVAIGGAEIGIVGRVADPHHVRRAQHVGTDVIVAAKASAFRVEQCKRPLVELIAESVQERRGIDGVSREQREVAFQSSTLYTAEGGRRRLPPRDAPQLPGLAYALTKYCLGKGRCGLYAVQGLGAGDHISRACCQSCVVGEAGLVGDVKTRVLFPLTRC